MATPGTPGSPAPAGNPGTPGTPDTSGPVAHRATDDAHVFSFQRADLTDGALIKRVGDEIYHVVRRLDSPRVVVDFASVERLSSATLGMLVALHKVLSRQSGQLRIAALRDDLEEVFRLTKLSEVVPVCGTTEEAIESFRT